MLAVHPALHLAAYHFAHGTFQPAATGSARGCAELDSLLDRGLPADRTAGRPAGRTSRPAGYPATGGLLGGGPRLADLNASADLDAVLDVCFDAQFSCSHARPFVGMGTVQALSEGDPQAGEQASIRIEGSDTWLPALVPVHAPRGSRTSTTRAVPVVGCFVHNRFVLSWADMRCRSMADTPFPAECDGASQRNVAIEDAAAAISFVESLSPQETRRKLDLGDTDNSFVKGKKTAVMVLISPSDADTAADAWNYGMIARDYGGSPNAWVDSVVRRSAAPPSCATVALAPPPSPAPSAPTRPRVCLPTDDEGQHDVLRLVVGRGTVRVDHRWAVQDDR